MKSSTRARARWRLLWSLASGMLLAGGLCGCLATIPSPGSQQTVPAEIKQVFRESGDRYLADAEAALARARVASSPQDARHEQAAAWSALEAAWERHVLSDDPAGIGRVLRAAALAEPGGPPESVDEPLALFAEMMKRLRSADPQVRDAPAIRSVLGELHTVAREAPTTFEAVKRDFTIERELWQLEDGSRGDSAHLRHLEELLRAAELSPALRGKIPYKWSRDSAAGLHVQK